MSNDNEFWSAEAQEHMRMNNETKGTQPLPLDVPAQPSERYRVRQIPGLALWFVLDSLTGQPRTYPHPDHDGQQSRADKLNEAEQDRNGKP